MYRSARPRVDMGMKVYTGATRWIDLDHQRKDAPISAGTSLPYMRWCSASAIEAVLLASAQSSTLLDNMGSDRSKRVTSESAAVAVQPRTPTPLCAFVRPSVMM